MIPNKSVFKFQELTPITGVKPYVIRFWETEFEEIAPVMSDSGQKLYARKDIEAILKIKDLLFEEKRTIIEAKDLLRSQSCTNTSTVSGTEGAFSDGTKDTEQVLVERSEARNSILASLLFIHQLKLKRNWT